MPIIGYLIPNVNTNFVILAICIFRMVQLISTRTVKLIHTMFHLIVILLMSFGYYPIFEQRSSLNEVTYHHAFPALIVYAVYLLQVIIKKSNQCLNTIILYYNLYRHFSSF